MKKIVNEFVKLVLLGLTALTMTVVSCSKDDPAAEPEVIDPTDDTPSGFDINTITDTYADLAPVSNVYQWGYRNVHDPSVIKVGNTYYCYSTDVAYGATVQPGIQIRKSTDLIQWQFVGWVFNQLPVQGSAFIQGRGTDPFNALWAPYIVQVGSQFRLYYSLSSAFPRLSVIGLATSSSPVGPWTEQGLAVTSVNDVTVQTNAIDPTVLVDQSGNHWMYYGSAWDGIYKLQLNPATGLAMTPGDKGTRVSRRGSTGGVINGNEEGAEIIYNAQFNKYYLFVAYDWLQTKYNVRVGRSDNPDGPFYDYNGVDLNTPVDHGPMILAPYKFNGHSGWQGVSHCGVFKDDANQYYMAHQGRPGIDSYYMDLHIRKVFWTEDGWPVVSPERYAGVAQTEITAADLAGNYEQIVLGYQVVPGYDQEQTSPDFQTSVNLTLDSSGSVNGDSNNHWTLENGWLTLQWGTSYTDKLHVERGRDWENNVTSTILLSGLNQQGTAIWGKKIN
ncbi:arabinan endo-1,5-alpha-L-arabinosidase [Flavobacterium silvaticum]|uniref:Family 43 glycosylhydrolase n=1 Tax=Flavobacterium silvaticum TaxID=1852020 RepID=A0A972JI48_9FLAO|nr:arabinan endo-1,5-alpha-L-arabinosidase [Flavobacterium silvaticum]NMH28620.1 family 43 glycosylhydrolase [Flavobacterium silvaticum]